MNEKRITFIGVLILAILLIVILFTRNKPSQFQGGSEFYVSLTGNDSNNGSKDSPWRSISFAVEALAPGDKLCIGPGVWSGTKDVIDSQRYNVPSGIDFSTQAITIGGCNGEYPTIKPVQGEIGVRLTTNAPHHIIFQDMTFDGSLQPDPPCCNPANGVIYDAPELLYTSSGAHHIRFQRLKVQHSMSHAVQVSYNGSSNTTPTYIEFIENEFIDIGNATGDSGHGGPGINNGYAIYMFTANNTVYHNIFHETRGTALVVYGPDNIVSANKFFNTGTRGGPGHAVNFGSSSHPVPSNGNYFVNNYVYDNVAGGLQIYTNASVNAWNNTFYNNVFAIHAQYCNGGSVQNNIFNLNGRDYYNDSPDSCSVTEANNLPSTIDPKFIDVSKKDFRIQSSSPAYNKGTIVEQVKLDITGVTTRPQSTSFDIGAYELPTEDPINPPNVGGEGKVFNLGSTITVIESKAGLLRSLVCYNPNNRVTFVQLFDSITRIEPYQSYGVPANSTLPLTGLNLAFLNSVGAAASFSVNGESNPTNKVTCSFGVTPVR